jgi:hypothetical protein
VLVYVPDAASPERDLAADNGFAASLIRCLPPETAREIAWTARLDLSRTGQPSSTRLSTGLEAECKAGRLLAVPRRLMLEFPWPAGILADATAVEDQGSAGKAAPPPGGGAASVTEKPGKGRVPHHRPPKEVVSLPGINKPGSPKTIKLEKDTAAAYQRMVEHARDDGFEEPLFLIVSGWRDEKLQAELYAKALIKYGSAAEARKWVAPPGHSAHGTGCAVDLWLGFACGKENNELIKDSEAYDWLTENANAHGFNPYDLEGWHWEYYVGD